MHQCVNGRMWQVLLSTLSRCWTRYTIFISASLECLTWVPCHECNHQKRVISYPNDVVSTPAMALRRRPTGRTRMMTMNVLDDQVTDFFWLENSSFYEFVWQKIQGGFKPNTSQGCMRRLRFISSVTCRVVVIQPPGQTTKTWYMIKLMKLSW